MKPALFYILSLFLYWGFACNTSYAQLNSRSSLNTFTYLIVKANKSSAITVNINGKELERIPAGMSRRIPLNHAASLRISLSDRRGNQYDTAFTVGDKDAYRNIVVAFPEIDDEATKTKEPVVKNVQYDKSHLQLEEERKEAAAVLRLRRVSLMNEAESNLKTLMKQTLADKIALQLLIDKIKSGEIPVTAEIVKAQALFLSGKTLVVDNIKNYSDSGTVYNMKERSDRFLKEIKADEDRITKDELHHFLPAVLAGKQPMSNTVEVAFKASRVTDIPFFIAKDDMENAMIAGKHLLDYALDVRSDTSVFRYLFDNGISPDNFGTRFSENTNIYATPLTHACMNGDPGVLKLFLNKAARFFPNNLTAFEKNKQMRFLLTKFVDKANVLALLKDAGYDVTHNSSAISLALAIHAIDSSMVFVNGGAFTMGCTSQLNADCASDEMPAINVTVDDFYISRFEVTQKIWEAIMEGDNPSFFSDCPDCPVEMVSWDAATEFIRKLNQLSGKKYRLPYEAEWEFAARGGNSEDKTLIYAGSKEVNEVAWCKENTNKTSVVGTKKPNALGLYDMSGNVAEWCHDFYAADYFSHSTRINPKGPETSAQKVISGGSFMQSSCSSRLSNREGHEAGFTNNNTGSRLARSY
jgi:formylglycine-generating enzyme required for sulfatase activity